MSNINDRATVELFVNGEQAEAAMDRLKKKAADLDTQMRSALDAGDHKKAAKLQKEFDKVTREINRTESAAKGAGVVLNNLSNTSIHGLRNALKYLQKQLAVTKPDTETWRRYAEQIEMVKGRIAELNGELEGSQSLWSKFKGWATSAWPAIDLLKTWGGDITNIARDCVDAYASMDQEMANVRKFTGMTAEQVDDLNEEFKKMDTRTSREDLNKLAQEAGRLGKTSKEDVLGFVRAADQINVALDELGDGATLELSKLTGIFGDEARYGTEQSLLKVGSVVNDLSQNCRASAPYLVEFASRMGGVGAQANMTIPQIMAFGAVLDSNGQKVEASSTALSQVLTRMMADPAKYAKVAGLEVGKFTTLLKQDANAALMLFLETLQKAGGMDVLSPMFQDMGENGSRAIAALSTLATHIDEVKAQQEAANQAFKDGTSVGKEFTVQNTTVQAGLDKCKKAANELKTELGEQLAPLMGHMFTATSALIKATLTIIKFVGEHKSAILALAAALSAYLLVVKSELVLKKLRNALDTAHYGLLVLDEKVTKRLAVVTEGLRLAYYRFTGQVGKAMVAQRSFNAAMSATPWGAVITAVTTFIGVLGLFSSSTKSAAEETENFADTQKKLADAEKEAEANCAAEVTQLDALYKATQDQNLAMADRIAAVKKLQELYPDVFSNLSQEAILAGQAADAYDRLRTSILRSAKAEARKSLLVDIENQLIGVDKELNDELAQFVGQVIIPEDKKHIFSDDNIGRYEYVTGLKAANRPLTEAENVALMHYFVPTDKNAPTAAGYYAAAKQKKQRLKNESNNIASAIVDDAIEGAKADNPDVSRFAQEDAWRTEQEKKAKDSYLKQETDYKRHTTKMNEIAAEYYKKILSRSDLTDKEREKYLDEYWKLQDKATTAATKDRKKKEAEDKREAAKAKKEFKAQINAYKAQRTAADAEALELYRSDSINYDELMERRHENEIKYYADSIALFEEKFADQKDTYLRDDKDYQALLLGKEKAEEQYNKAHAAQLLEAIKRRQSADEQSAQHEFDIKTNPTIADEIKLQANLFNIRKKALEDQQALYTAGSKEYADLAYQIEQLVTDNTLAQKKIYFKAVAALQEEYNKKSVAEKYEMEKAALDVLLKENILTQEQYDKFLRGLKSKSKTDLPGASKSDAWTDADQQKYDADKKALDDALAKKIISQEEYNNRVANIEKERRDKMLSGLKSVAGEWNGLVTNIYTSLMDFVYSLGGSTEGALQKLSALVGTTAAAVGAGMQIASQFAQAEADIQLKAVEKRYDREIELAQGNSYKVAKAEKKKEKETAKIKNEASKKQYAMQIVQAIAQAIQAGLNAYAATVVIPVVGPALAPAAAALAVATGMAQVALLKKQQQAAAAQGYSKGGFTKPGPVDEPAGIVHAGEWVASQRLLSNPVARPMIEALDRAQRTNTIGSLRPADVSRSIRANDSLVRMAESNDGSALMVAAALQMSRTVSRLNNRLDEPFVTVNTVTGDKGIKRAQDEYTRLMNNKSPKSRRNATDN